MNPGCVIVPHVGYSDKELRIYLCLYSNPHAALKVGSEVGHWGEGELLMFDDSVPHSA